MLAKGRIFFVLIALLVSPLVSRQAKAISVTETGTLAADNSVYTYDFTVAATQTYLMWTTSYAGGSNLNGTTSAAGGFVPVLTLFSSSGAPVANDGADGVCEGYDRKDAVTGLCNDAYISTVLTPGSYVLDLTEFPNVAIGSVSDGFLFSSDPSATGDTCGGSDSGKMFLEADLTSCPQRTDAFALNVANVPEPGTLWLAIPVIGLIACRSKRLFVRS